MRLRKTLVSDRVSTVGWRAVDPLGRHSIDTHDVHGQRARASHADHDNANRVLKWPRTIRLNLDWARPTGELEGVFLRRTLGWLPVSTSSVDRRSRNFCS